MTVAALSHDPRSAEILDRIKGAFATKGFDGASMQDLARAAGMSAGNFYRYFPSKNAIIAAIVTRDLYEVQREFNEIIRSPRPRDTLRDLIRRRLDVVEGEKGAMFAEISATASRRPEVAALLSQMESGILGYLIAVFARIADVTPEEARLRYSAHGRLIMLLIHGLSMGGCKNTAGSGPVADSELADLVMTMIDRTLAEIAEVAPGPAAVAMKPMKA